MFQLKQLDHFVLTVLDIDKSVDFYTQCLGMELIEFGNGRKALKFGCQKINLHEKGKEFEPKSIHPTPGSADLCFITETPLPQVVTHLQTAGIEIFKGPVPRTGAQNPLSSVYVRDPDMNLIEISNELQK